MALPNPNDKLVSSSQTQTLTLKDLLYYQMETEKWSQNTDVNTFRGYIEEKQQGEELIEQIKQIQTGEQNSLKALTDSSKGIFTNLENKFKTDSEQLMSALKRSVNFLSDPFEKFFKTQGGKEYADFGANVFSATAQLERGSERLNSGFKELTNGIGALGPAINTIRTIAFKVTAVFNLLIGTVQIVAGLFGKLFKFVGGLFGFGKEEKEREKLEKEHLETQNALAEKEAEIAKQEKLEGINQKLVDPLPLPVTMGDSSSVVPSQDQSKQFKGIEMPDGSMSLDEPTEAQNLRSEKLMKMDEERAELQKKYDKLDEERNKKLDEEQGKSSNKFGKMGLVLLGLLIAMILAIKNDMFSAPARLLSEGLSRLTQSFKNGLKRILPNSVTDFFRGNRNIPGRNGNPLARVPRGMQVDINGKPYKGGQMLPEGYKIQGDKVINVADGSASRLTKILGVVGREAIPIAGSTYEGVVDFQDNDAKFQAIKTAFEAGEDFNFKDGPRPMTEEEFRQVELAQAGNFGGSVGRSAGGFTGAAIGFKQGMKSLAKFKWSDLINPVAWAKRNPYVAGGKVALYTLGGGIFGAEVGDMAGTEIPEIFTGIDDSQGVLDEMFKIAPVVGDELENATNEVLDETTNNRNGGGDSNTQMNATNINQDNSTTITSKPAPFSDYFKSHSYSNPIHWNSMK